MRKRRPDRPAAAAGAKATQRSLPRHLVEDASDERDALSTAENDILEEGDEEEVEIEANFDSLEVDEDAIFGKSAAMNRRQTGITSTASEEDEEAELANDKKTMVSVDDEIANKYLSRAFPELAAQYAASGCNATPVEDVHTDSAVVASWKCPKCDGVWKSAVFLRCILKNNCPRCSALEMPTLAKARPDLVQLWNRKANDPFICPEQVPINSRKSVYWLCPTCRESFQARVKDRVQEKVRCPSCTLLQGQSADLLASEDTALLQEWHPLRNGDLRMDQLQPTDNKAKVWWLCASCGHEWEATLSSRLARRGRQKGRHCPACNGQGLEGLL